MMNASEPVGADPDITKVYESDLVPADDSLDAAEAGFAEAARAPSTLRGYRSDWAEFTAWCHLHGHTPLPADDIAISRYISTLATAGAKTGTISRRLSTIKFAHKVRNYPDPTQTARITAVWEGIRRSLGTTPDQARPLMPPLLLDVLDACPTLTSWKTRPDEPSLTGARDRALLLLGFVSAMRPSEIAALTLNQIQQDGRGRVIELTHSKTNQRGKLEHVVLPRGYRQVTCPITALDHWLQLSNITDGPVFRKVTKGNKPTTTPLTADGLSRIVTGAVGRAGYDPAGYSGHSLRAGFATYAVQRGATAQQVAHQTRHKSLASVGIYTRIEDAWEDNAATRLGLSSAGPPARESGLEDFNAASGRPFFDVSQVSQDRPLSRVRFRVAQDVQHATYRDESGVVDGIILSRTSRDSETSRPIAVASLHGGCQVVAVVGWHQGASSCSASEYTTDAAAQIR